MEMKKGKKQEIEESDLPSSKEKQKTVMVVHKTSGKELKIQASALDKYKAMGYKLMEEVEDVEEAESHQSKTTMKHNLLMSKWEHQGALLSDMANILDSLNDCDAPNAMHAKVAVIEKIIDVVTNMEA